MRDLPSDVWKFAHDLVQAYRLGWTLPLPQQCTSLPSLYRTVVRDVRYIRDLDSSGNVVGRANVVLRSATLGYRLSAFKLAPSVAWVGFAPNPDIISIGDAVLYNCLVQSVDFRGLPNVVTIGDMFLYGCCRLTTIDLSPLSNIRLAGNKFVSR